MTAAAILSPVPSKTCKKCGQGKPATEFYKQSSSKDGLHPYCKPCGKDLQILRRLSPEKIAALDRYQALHKAGQKECGACHVVKPHSEFYIRPDRNEFKSRCKICESEHRSKKWASDPEKAKALSKARYAATADQQKAKKRAEYWADPVKASAANKRQREKHREARLAGQRAYYQANKESLKAKGREHYKANKQSYLDGNRRRVRDRIKVDPVFALSTRIRSLIYARIYSGGYTKKSRSQEILGCTWPEFKLHIERQFLKGMSWDRLSEIHLDHIVPIATAKTEEEVIALNHFTNIRPMWAKDNLSKGAQVTHLI